jgi:hypothetical protein
VPPANSTKPLVFNPTGRCPSYDVDPQIAQAAVDKQRNDEYQLAQLIAKDVPTAPLNPETDGGMNRVFAAKLENPTYTYDNEGHLHVPPLQPGRLPPAISGPDSAVATTAGTSGVGSLFSSVFAAKPAPAAAPQVAATEPESGSHPGFFASLFGAKHDSAAPAASDPDGAEPAATGTAKPKAKPAAHTEPSALAGLRLKPPRETDKSDVADAAKPRPAATPARQQEASAVPGGAPSTNSGLLSGAQPVRPSGSFDSRWGGVQ